MNNQNQKVQSIPSRGGAEEYWEEWREVKLGEAINLKRGYDLPSRNRQDGKIPIFSSSGISGYHNQGMSDGPGVITGRYGTIGQVYYSHGAYWPLNTTLYVQDFRGNDTHFFFYFLQQLDWKKYSDKSAVPGVNRNDVHQERILLPPLPEQKAIASVLSSLDDKIDLLHRQNKTLEAMAEALFRQWFVEEVDESWEEDSLLELIELVGGGTPKTANAEYWDGDIPWLTGGDIASNHKSFVLNSEKRITDLGLNNSSAKLLPKYSTVISARGTVGKYCILAKPMAFSQSNYGILPRKQNCFFFSYLLINHVVEELQTSAYGSVFDTITTNTFRDIKIAIPTETVISNFESQVAVYFKKIIANIEQINLLEKLRATLLPKLMSGEVRVEV